MNSAVGREWRGTLVLIALLAAYIIGAVYWIPRTRGQMNPDGISYLSIAHRYLEGNFREAVSGHWGPMFSWLLVPLLALQAGPFLACKIQMFATGLVALGGAWLWSRRYTELLAVRAVVCAALIPFFLTWAAAAVTPDLLVACLLIYYAYFISDPSLSQRSTILAALFGALGYYAKSYCFVFYLVHFPLVCAVRWFYREKEARRVVIRRAALGLAVFLGLCLPWVAILSVKYERLTFGTAASYNFGLVGPASGPVGSQPHPMHTQGLLAPPNEHATSAWDDPAQMHFPAWPSTGESVPRLYALVRANLVALNNSVLSISWLGWFILAAGLVFPLLDRLRHPTARLLFASVLSGALFVGGFAPLIIETRYIWILFVLELMIVAGLVDLFPPHFRWRSIAAALVTVAVAFTFVASSQARPPRPGPIEVMSARVAKALRKNRIELRGRRLASNDDWAQTLYLASLMDARYFGTVLQNDPARARQQIDQHRIDTFLVWGIPAASPAYLAGFHLVASRRKGLQFALYQRER